MSASDELFVPNESQRDEKSFPGIRELYDKAYTFTTDEDFHSKRKWLLGLIYGQLEETNTILDRPGLLASKIVRTRRVTAADFERMTRHKDVSGKLWYIEKTRERIRQLELEQTGVLDFNEAHVLLERFDPSKYTKPVSLVCENLSKKWQTKEELLPRQEWLLGLLNGQVFEADVKVPLRKKRSLFKDRFKTIRTITITDEQLSELYEDSANDPELTSAIDLVRKLKRLSRIRASNDEMRRLDLADNTIAPSVPSQQNIQSQSALQYSTDIREDYLPSTDLNPSSSHHYTEGYQQHSSPYTRDMWELEGDDPQ